MPFLAAALALGGPDEPPRYTAVDLACATFLEKAEIDVTLQNRTVTQEETIHREGLFRIRGRREDDLVRFEGWYDSLTLRRQSPVGLLVPDTDGLIGGRWRGWLGAGGGVELSDRPFIPPDVASVADLSNLPADFFPPLPPISLAPGARWGDSTGLEIQRLPDSAAAPRTLRRYAWTLDVLSAGDPAAGTLGQRTSERGILAWDDSLGPAGWTRQITVDAQVRPARTVQTVLRSRVEQSLSVRRVMGARCS